MNNINPMKHHKLCEKCNKFAPYHTSYMFLGTEFDRIPDNCVTWLCNDKKCPLDLTKKDDNDY